MTLNFMHITVTAQSVGTAFWNMFYIHHILLHLSITLIKRNTVDFLLKYSYMYMEAIKMY